MFAVVAAFLVLLGGLFGHTGLAQAQEVPSKKIRIFNNSAKPLYVIIGVGQRPTDEWLQSWFRVTDPAKAYRTTRDSRIYVNGTKGIPANSSVEVTIPLYSQLVANPTGTSTNEYVNWWNGGRVWFYDDPAQVAANFKKDSANTIAPVTAAPCVGPVDGGPCVPIPIFASTEGLPGGDLMQLMEYTFGDAITAGGQMPYPFHATMVGYNISSVDQAYLPVAMQPLGNKLIPYIGSVLGLDVFRQRMTKFLTDHPGWPVYKPGDPARPRIPEAHTIFLDAFTQNSHLTTPGAAVETMRQLYRTCISSQPSKPPICAPYQEIVALIKENYRKYQLLSCRLPHIVDNELTILQKIYGWVPFDEGCPAGTNSLVDTFGKAKFDELLNKYIHQMQYTADRSFNPYVKLIHDPQYLDMAAYAFSVDDAISFQHYKGDGLIITFAGSHGLDNKEKLDKSKQVTVSLGISHGGVAQWANVGICSNEADYMEIDPNAPFYEFYPPSFPCMFTATDLKGKKYQLVVQSGPPSLTKSCTGVSNVAWCERAVVDGPQHISTIVPDPSPRTSTHDFNGDGKSDILMRHPSGGLAMWLMNGATVTQSAGIGTMPTDWQVVAQRDFDGDGKADMLWRDANGHTIMWLMNGTRIIVPLSVADVGPDWHVAGTGDFLNNGKGGIVWRHTSGAVAMWLMSGGHVDTSRGVGVVDPSWNIIGTGDYNGDGKSDILWRDASGNIAVWFMNDVSVLETHGIGHVPLNWTVVGGGDYNGDGKSDILWREAGGAIAIWLMNGSVPLSTTGVGVVGTDWSVGTTGDFNFDGKTDILWRHNSGGTALWFMDGTTITSSQPAGVIAPDWVIQTANSE